MLMRIFFASDIHASTKCWLKFLSARRHFGCDVLIIGGDITGKFIVPVIQSLTVPGKPNFSGETTHAHRRRS